MQERYIAALVLPLFIWAGHGLIELGDWLGETTGLLISRKDAKSQGEKGGGMRWLIWLPTALLMVFFLVITPRQIDSAYLAGSVRPVHLQAAAELAPYVQPGDVVMSRYVAIAWHSGAEWLPTPAAGVDETLAYARHHGAKFWAIDGYEAHNLRPQFAPLVDDPENPPPGLTLLLIVPDATGQEPVVIYQLTPSS